MEQDNTRQESRGRLMGGLHSTYRRGQGNGKMDRRIENWTRYRRRGPEEQDRTNRIEQCETMEKRIEEEKEDMSEREEYNTVDKHFPELQCTTTKAIFAFAVVRLLYPFAEVAGELNIAREGISKRLIEAKHFDQWFSFDDMQIAVGQRTDISRALSHCRLFPEEIAKCITFTCNNTTCNVQHKNASKRLTLLP